MKEYRGKVKFTGPRYQIGIKVIREFGEDSVNVIGSVVENLMHFWVTGEMRLSRFHLTRVRELAKGINIKI